MCVCVRMCTCVCVCVWVCVCMNMCVYVCFKNYKNILHNYFFINFIFLF